MKEYKNHFCCSKCWCSPESCECNEEPKTSNHHILPRSKGWSNNRNNLLTMPHKFHQSLHYVFKNKTPVEQIETLLELNEKALTIEFKARIYELLNDIKWREYKPNIKLWEQ